MNTKAKYTAGPWEIKEYSGPSDHVIICDEERNHIAEIVLKSNARLIACAPELLEACKFALALGVTQCPQGVDPDYWESVWATMLEAVVKAEGNSK